VSSQFSATEELLAGWDDDEVKPTEVAQPTLHEAMSEGEPAEEEEETVPAGPGEPATEPAQEEGEEEAEEEDEGEEAGEDEGEEESEEEGEGVRALTLDSVEVSDAEILAYLAQYQNDPVKALRAAAELRRAFGRQGTDLAAVRQRVQELEYQAAQARALSAGMTPMTQEQHEWAEGAANSGNPGAYIEQAMGAGEFGLARAVCTYWAREDPFNAGRAGQWIDAAEQQAYQPQIPVEADTRDILDALKAKVPGFAEWEPQMVAVFNNLGPEHHLVQEARSNNIDTSMRALLNIFEIAQASSASVQEQKTEIKKRARADAAGARAAAAVTSGANSPGSSSEPPRSQQIMPGLTMEQLDTEFAEAS